MIILKWDMSSSIVFDSFVKNQKTKKKLLPQDVDKIYFGLGFDPE